MKQCPRCGQIGAQVLEHNGRKRTVCSNCGWDGPACYGEKWEAHNPKCAGGVDPTYWDESTKSHKRPACGAYQPCASELQRARTQNLGPAAAQPFRLPQAPAPAAAFQTSMPQQPPQMMPRPTPPQSTPSVNLKMPDGSTKVLTLGAPSRTVGPTTPMTPMSVPVRAPSTPTMGAPQYPVPQPQPAAPGMMQPMAYQTYHNGQPVMVLMVPPQQASQPALVPQNAVQPGSQAMAVITVPEPETAPYFKRLAGSVGRSMLKYGFLEAANMMDHAPWWR